MRTRGKKAPSILVRNASPPAVVRVWACEGGVFPKRASARASKGQGFRQGDFNGENIWHVTPRRNPIGRIQLRNRKTASIRACACVPLDHERFALARVSLCVRPSDSGIGSPAFLMEMSRSGRAHRSLSALRLICCPVDD